MILELLMQRITMKQKTRRPESQFRAAASDSLPASVQFNFVDLEGQTRKDRSQSASTKTVTLGILPIAKHSSERNHAPLMLQNVGIEGVAVQC